MNARLRHLIAPAPRAARPHIGTAGVCDVIRIAMQAGVALPRALEVAGQVSGWELLAQAGAALGRGAGWDSAWAWVDQDQAQAPQRAVGRALASELAPTWELGLPPGPALRALARAVRAEAVRTAAQSVAKLGVRLVLPLGLCYLPAFFLVGVLPLVLSVLADVF